MRALNLRSKPASRQPSTPARTRKAAIPANESTDTFIPMMLISMGYSPPCVFAELLVVLPSELELPALSSAEPDDEPDDDDEELDDE